jgi:hypothetical protein
MQTRYARLSAGRSRKAPTPPRSIVPRLEVLEDRTVPTLLLVNTVLDTGVSGDGSLRGEIKAANPAGGDTIVFAPGVTTVNVTNPAGALVIDRSLTIQGPSGGLETIQGNNFSQVFRVNSGVNATLNNLQIQGGFATTSATVSGGGGIDNFGNLTLNNDRVTGNTLFAGAAVTTARGGGIENETAAALAINNCTIDNNTSNGNGFGAAFGGGIESKSTVTITNSTIANNTATATGGANQAHGGGLLIRAGSTATLINCTVSGNTASGPGGSDGGGIRMGANPGNTLTLLNSIVANNTATTGPDVNIESTSPPTVVFNEQGNVFGTAPSVGAMVTVNDQGGETVGDPQLGALQDNGGPTPTEAIPTSGPAFLGGVSSSILGTVPTTDQRGDARVASMPGIGAFAPAVPTAVTITGVSEQYSLFSQMETVSVQVTFANGQPVTQGSVTITDGGQHLTANLDSSGKATVTFTFQLFLGQEMPNPHPIAVTFNGSSAFGTSSGSTNAPNSTLNFFFQLFFDFQLFMALMGG